MGVDTRMRWRMACLGCLGLMIAFFIGAAFGGDFLHGLLDKQGSATTTITTPSASAYPAATGPLDEGTASSSSSAAGAGLPSPSSLSGVVPCSKAAGYCPPGDEATWGATPVPTPTWEAATPTPSAS